MARNGRTIRNNRGDHLSFRSDVTRPLFVPKHDDDLVVRRRHRNARSYRWRQSVEHTTSDNEELGALLLGEVALVALELLPRPGVHRVDLGLNIRHYERRLVGIVRARTVRGWTHMTAVVPASRVVGRLDMVEVRGQERVGREAALPLRRSNVRRHKTPAHPIRDKPRGVVGRDVVAVVEQHVVTRIGVRRSAQGQVHTPIERAARGLAGSSICPRAGVAADASARHRRVQAVLCATLTGAPSQEQKQETHARHAPSLLRLTTSRRLNSRSPFATSRRKAGSVAQTSPTVVRNRARTCADVLGMNTTVISAPFGVTIELSFGWSLDVVDFGEYALALWWAGDGMWPARWGCA